MPELNPTPSHPQPAAAIAPGVPGTDQVGGNLPRQRWDQPAANPRLAGQLAKVTGLSPLLTQVLINRGLTTPEQAADFLEPERLQLPPPLEEFPDLGVSLELLVNAIETQQAIAICGDYDADGMTSTALLLRALRLLGGKVDYTIPSRMAEGYGINTRIVEDCYGDGVSLILTVDNGIAARDPIARARELGLAVIVTDHHDLPPELPPANAILNPKLLPETSPYRGVAGVGVAYILAVCLAQLLDKTQDLTGPLLELFTLGTIADLAPLTGVNRRWVRRGLGLLPRSRLFGIQALIQVAGLADQSKPLKPEHIGFRLGPRINAVGRISDPQVVIDLLTTDDVGVALERAMQCEQINATRQELCQTIEQEAIAWCEYQQHHGHLDLGQQRVLVVVQPGWHHGVIGIVASRLVERYGVPVFIGTYEDDDQTVIRGSARGIPEFDVFEALQSCHDLLEKFGGHRAAGGFSFLAKHLRQVTMRLSNYACQTLQAEWLKPLVKIDVQARLEELNQALYDQIDHLHPCGIENPDPVFWTPQVQVLEQQIVGRNRDHLKLVVAQGSSPMKAIAWRWGAYYPLPDCVDIAYKLKQNEWQGVTTVELELVGVRLPNGGELPPVPTPALKPPPPPIPPFGQEPSAVLGVATPAEPAEAVYAAPVAPQPSAPELPTNPANFSYKQRRYWSSLAADTGQLTISNPENQRLVVVLEDDQGSVQGDQGTLYLPDQAPRPVDVSDSHYAKLIQAGRHAIEIQRLTQQLEAQARQLEAQEAEIQRLTQALRQRSLSQPTPGAIAVTPSAPHPLEGQSPEPDPQTAPAGMAGSEDEREAGSEKGTTETASSPPDGPVKAQVRQTVGEALWTQLQPLSQGHLCTAFEQQQCIQGTVADKRKGDYSAAAIALIQALEQELLPPLIQGISQYGQQTGDADVVALATDLRRMPQLSVLPPLLSESWQIWSAKALKAAGKPRKDLYQTVIAEGDQWATPFPIDVTYRVVLHEFLQGWDDPRGPWLTVAHDEVASAVAQVVQLRQLALAPKTALRWWQYQGLQQLWLGQRQTPGLLQQMLGVGG